jgi:hypothetical protein
VSRATEEVFAKPKDLLSERTRRISRLDHGKVKLLKGGNASFPQNSECVLHDAERIGHMDQDVPAYYRIEHVVSPVFIDTAIDERNICEALLPYAFLCRAERLLVHVERSHLSMAANQPGGHHGKIPDAAADIENTHSASNTGAPHKLFGEWVEYQSLEGETAAFAVAMAHDVA